MKPRHRRVDLHARLARLRNPHLGMREHPVGHVQPTIRPPGEPVEQLMPVVQTKAGHQHCPLVRHIAVLGVFEKQQVRRLPDKHPAVAQLNRRGQVQAVRKDRHLVRPAVAIRVFQNFDPVTRFGSRGRAHGILIQFHHPQPPAVVPRHGHRIDHVGLRGEQAHLKPFGHHKAFLRFGGRQGRGGGGRPLARQLAALGSGPKGRSEQTYGRAEQGRKNGWLHNNWNLGSMREGR